MGLKRVGHDWATEQQPQSSTPEPGKNAVPMAQPRNRGLKRHSKTLKTLPRPAHLTLGHPCLLLGLAASSLEADTRQYFLCINRGWVLVDGCPSGYYTLEQTSGGSPAVQHSVWLKKPETRTFITLRLRGSRASSARHSSKPKFDQDTTTPGEERTTHSSILAWEIPRTEEPSGLQSMGSQESDRT